MYIPELSKLDDILDIEEDYEKRYGAVPYRLSTWDQGHKVRTIIENSLRLDLVNDDPTSYIFSYTENDLRKKIMSSYKLSNDKELLITPTGSSSILSALYFLKSNGIEELVAACPVYFTVPSGASKLNIQFEEAHVLRGHKGYRLPVKTCLEKAGPGRALWITNPVYCTGNYYSIKDIEFVRELVTKYDFVVLDECLAHPSMYLFQHIQGHNIISIQCPHKTICMNGLKFSSISFDKSYYDHFTQWADVLQGCLSIATKGAMAHYLSDNYEEVIRIFYKRVNSNYRALSRLMSEYTCVDMDAHNTGYLATIYARGVNGSLADDITVLRDLIFKSGTSFIPGLRNHFSPKLDFNFRVNLTHYGKRFESALVRLIIALQDYTS